MKAWEIDRRVAQRVLSARKYLSGRFVAPVAWQEARMMGLVAFFWLLSLVLLVEGVTEKSVGWLIAAGAVAIVAILLSVLVLAYKLVERGRRR